jgi:hypothetical protein
MRHSHVIVLHDDPDSRHERSGHGGERLAARLRRMTIGRITTVTRTEEAKRLCRAGGVDACLVVMGDEVPDAAPEALAAAPGQPFGVPTVLVAPMVTRQLRKTARLCGYRAVLPARIAPRMLYRRIGAVLQGRRRQRVSKFGRTMMTVPAKSSNLAKPTVH